VNRIAVIGGGIAGAMLAWRLTDHRDDVEVHLYTGAPARRFDASSASGGLIRAFETEESHAIASQSPCRRRREVAVQACSC